jgi:hypothetical protein
MASEVDGFGLQAPEAVRAAEVEVPDVVACNAGPPGVLMESVPGDGDHLALTDPDRPHRLDHQLLAELVKVHQIDTGPFADLGMAVPTTPEEQLLRGALGAGKHAPLLPIDQLR